MRKRLLSWVLLVRFGVVIAADGHVGSGGDAELARGLSGVYPV